MRSRQPKYRRYADRRVYLLDQSRLAAHGSIGDALRSIPSVEVDPEGNLTLRGSSKVTILVDGLPSGKFQGPNQAAMLQQVPAGEYQSVEVMTNPSAAYSPQGTGGIINLITKKSTANNRDATLGLAVSPNQHINGDLSFDTPIKSVALSGTTGFQDVRLVRDDSVQEQLVQPGMATAAASTLKHSQVTGGIQTGSLTAQYKPDELQSLAAELDGYRLLSGTVASTMYSSTDLTAPLAQDYRSTGDERLSMTGLSGTATYRRHFTTNNADLTLRLGAGTTSTATDAAQLLVYTSPSQANLFQDFQTASSAFNANFQGDYKVSPDPQTTVELGVEARLQQQTLSHSARSGVSSIVAVTDSSQDDELQASQVTYDGFATYERRVGRLDALLGVRFEVHNLAAHQTMQGPEWRSDYLNAYPTLHLDYQLNGKSQLTASYSRRVDYPTPQELNPFRQEYNPLSYYQGNESLVPALTDSFEVGLDRNDGPSYETGSLYYRTSRNQIDSVTENIGGGALLSTLANVGHSSDAGLELIAHQQLTSSLKLTLTGRLSWHETSSPDSPVTRSGLEAHGLADFDWTPTKRDFFQMTVTGSGRRFTAQGMVDPFWYLDVGYRHQLNDHVSLDLKVIDPFGTYRSDSLNRTPTLAEKLSQNPHIRAVEVGLTLFLGGQAAQNTRDFKFDAGGLGQ